MTFDTTARPVEAELPRDLTPREAELLKRAGERVFTLSRKLADANRQIEQLRSQVTHLTDLLAELRQTREILSNQIMALQMERERDYEERAELRKLLASTQMFMNAMVNAQSRLHLLEARVAPQRGRLSAPRPSSG